MGVCICFCGGVEKWLSRQAHNLKVVGSNPTPTKYILVPFELNGSIVVIL